MSEQVEIWKCPKCGMELNIAPLGFYEKLICPGCKAKARVHTLLANFRLSGILGKGGMSVVYDAHDMVLNRTVAVKILHDHFGDFAELASRFEAECANMARVRHENVVAVYSAGWAAGRFYIAMEKVEGRNLAEVVADHKCLLPLEALDVVRQVAEGLQAAAECGVLHRDIKPGNVIVTPEGLVKVLDFGLAADSASLTGAAKEGVIWATPFYVPPETLERKNEDERADIYALGMTLRSLLTGITDLAKQPETLEELMTIKSQLPSMLETYHNLDEALCDLVDHMTAFHPENRISSYPELLDAMAEVRRGLDKSENIVEKAKRRRRHALVLGGAVLGCGLVGAFWNSARVEPAVKYKALRVHHQVQWPDRDALQEAYLHMREQRYPQAAEQLLRLVKEGQDPAMRVAAVALLPLVEMGGEEPLPEVPDIRELLPKLSPQDAPVAKMLVEAMQVALPLLDKGSLPAKHWPKNLAALAPPLRVGLLVQAAKLAMEKNDSAAAMRYLEEAAIWAESSPEITHLGNAIDELRRDLPRRAALEQMALARKMMIAGKLKEALKVLRSVDTRQLSSLERADVGVQQEYVTVAQEMFAVLQKYRPDEFKPSASPDTLRRLAASLKKGKLADEVYAVAWLLHGDYARAEKENPYRDALRSDAPFAIIFRDWCHRLGR